MKTRIIFLTVSIIMIAIEATLGYMVFSFDNTWVTELLLIGMISITFLVAVTFVLLYRDSVEYEKTN